MSSMFLTLFYAYLWIVRESERQELYFPEMTKVYTQEFFVTKAMLADEQAWQTLKKTLLQEADNKN